MINNTNAKTHVGRRVLIAGGGIAGLSLARALKDAGHNPLVIERSREWPTTDTAHYLPVNALRALDQLGLGEAVTAAAHPISRQRVTGARGRTLVDLPVSSIWGNGGQSVAIRRNALHELLQAATSDVAVRRGTTIAARLRDGAIKLSDGSIEQYDVLVGADGADSVRTHRWHRWHGAAAHQSLVLALHCRRLERRGGHLARSPRPWSQPGHHAAGRRGRLLLRRHRQQQRQAAGRLAQLLRRFRHAGH